MHCEFIDDRLVASTSNGFNGDGCEISVRRATIRLSRSIFSYLCHACLDMGPSDKEVVEGATRPRGFGVLRGWPHTASDAEKAADECLHG